MGGRDSSSALCIEAIVAEGNMLVPLSSKLLCSSRSNINLHSYSSGLLMYCFNQVLYKAIMPNITLQFIIKHFNGLFHQFKQLKLPTLLC